MSMNAKAPKAEALLAPYRGLRVVGDKGYLSGNRQARLEQAQAVKVWPPKRKNQRRLVSEQALAQAFQRVRRVIESTFSQAKGWLGLEHTGAKTGSGLTARLVSKLTVLTLASWRKLQQGQPPLRLAGEPF